MDAAISFRDGRLYIVHAACEAYFGGSGSVALLRRGGDLLVLPVRHAAAGGYILKVRNSAGDRVVTAPHFFQAEGVADQATWEGAVAWRDDCAALALHDFFLDR
jgi:hypothetical protein